MAGCEFFTDYKLNAHSGLQLFFNWFRFAAAHTVLCSPSLPSSRVLTPRCCCVLCGCAPRNQSFISSALLLSRPTPMVPDEMLSVNGTLLPPAQRHSQAQADAMAPWYEFDHACAAHECEREA